MSSNNFKDYMFLGVTFALASLISGGAGAVDATQFDRQQTRTSFNR